MISGVDHIQILYEIALQIGEGQSLKEGCSKSLLAYLRKFNCSAGAILQKKMSEGATYFEFIHTVPIRLNKKQSISELGKIIPLESDNAVYSAVNLELPMIEEMSEDERMYLLDLPDFGLLMMIKKGEGLSKDLLYTLEPLNKKLADALLNFQDKERLHTQFEAMDASSSAIFISDREGTVEWVNEEWCRMNGYQKDEAIGQSIAVLLEYSQQDMFYRALWDLRISGDVWHSELESQRKDGNRFMAEISITPVKDSEGQVNRLIGISQDISLRVEGEERIRQSELFLNSLVQSIPDIMWMIDEEGIVRSCNEEFGEWFNVDKNRIIGKAPAALLHSRQVKWLNEHNSELSVENRIQQFEQVWIDESTEEKQYFDTVKALIEDPSREGGFSILGLSRNITSRKKAEADLIEAKVAAESAEKAQFNFLSTMSHEIRTPLNAVVGLSNILLMEKPREDQMNHLKTLKFSSENLLNIINDILDFNKMAAGKIALETSDFNLDELLRGIKFTFGEQARLKGIQLKFQLDPAVPEVVVGDSTRLLQIMNNLVGNSLKFTEKGSVTVKAIQERVSDSHIKMYLEVRDTGIGIPEDKIDTVFEDFKQSDNSITRKYGGTGLGLPIVKKLLEAMGSEIHVESVEGEGTTFHFEVLLRIGDWQKVQSLNKKSEIDNSLVGKTILLVEDNPVNQMIARKFLEDWGCIVEVAENGAIALEKITVVSYDLVLMDLQMPIMDGYKATKLIRSNPLERINELPVVALSASALGEIETRAKKFGMNAFVTKPFEPSKLFSVLRSVLNETRESV